MNDSLQIFICEHFKAETIAVLSSGDFQDVVPIFIPSRCSRPITPDSQLSSIPDLNTHPINEKLIFGCSCITPTDKKFLRHQNITYLPQVNCFHMFAPKELVDRLTSDGSYLMTPGWLSNWREWVEQWGGKDQAMQIFSESVTKLVLLDTGIDPNSKVHLTDFSEAINCRPETMRVGLDFYHLFLENEILKWRLRRKIDTVSLPSAIPEKNESDYAMALDLLSELPRAENEEIVAGMIMEALVMLFAPKKVFYLSVIDSKPCDLWSIPTISDIGPVKKRLSECSKPISQTESGNGFCLRIGKEDKILAVIEIDDLVIPEYTARYQNLSVAMTGVFALAIENSRYFQRIMEMNSKLQEANNTKDKFFSIIAHDLKSPFVTIMGFSEVLTQSIRKLDANKVEKYSSAIYDASKQAYSLLENLLVWAQSQNGSIEFKPEIFNLKELIIEIINFVESQSLRKKINIINAINEDILVFADSNMMNTILRNLLVNAIKFTHPGGKIAIIATSYPDHTQIAITDTGIGMNEETLNSLFRNDSQISTQGTENEKGTGLGLILCKEFIEKHRGKIWAKSKPDEGSVFYFTIPKKSSKT
jgi:signal transduction histidine kinase